MLACRIPPVRMKAGFLLVLWAFWSSTQYYVMANSVKRGLSFKVIYPGTKWCGVSDKADNYNDLGEHRGADMCCREHDKHCPLRIKPMKKKYHRMNFSLKVKSGCECEKRFKECLEKVKTSTSTNIFKIYFNGYNPDCIKLRPYTYEECVKRKWYGTCARHRTVHTQRAYFYDLHEELNMEKK